MCNKCKFKISALEWEKMKCIESNEWWKSGSLIRFLLHRAMLIELCALLDFWINNSVDLMHLSVLQTGADLYFGASLLALFKCWLADSNNQPFFFLKVAHCYWLLATFERRKQWGKVKVSAGVRYRQMHQWLNIK